MLIRYRNSITRKVQEMVLDASPAGLLHDSGRIYQVNKNTLYLIGSYNWPDRVDRNKIRWVKKPEPIDFGQITVGTNVEFFNREKTH